jgi:hypothetical protein
MSTTFFRFDELTWPEVAACGRDVPLILPLGSGYDWEKVSEGLSRPWLLLFPVLKGCLFLV